MIADKKAIMVNMPSNGVELLDHHPDPMLYFLPVQSEVEADNKVIDFLLAYANAKAAADGFETGQLLSGLGNTKSHFKTNFYVQWFQQLEAILQSGEKNEKQYYNADNKCYLKVTGTKVNEGILTIIQDVTIAEKARCQAEVDALLADALPSGLVVLEAIQNDAGAIADFVVVKVNKAFTNMFEWCDAYIGKSYTSLLPETVEIFKLKCSAITTGEVVTYKYNYKSKEGEKWFKIVLHKIKENYLAATVTDITEKRKAEEEQLHKNDQRLQVVFDTSKAGMYTLIPVRNENEEIIDFRFGLVNQAVASYLGLHADDMVGALGSLYFPAYKTNGLFDRYVETMKTGVPAMFDLHYADGYDNFFTIHVVKMGDELFGTFTDHSNLKRLQRELETSIAELRRSNASLEQFAHAASHDLQEPLRKITLYTSRLEEDHADEITDKAFSHIERIKTASKRMQRLIKDLLVFAEVGTNRMELEEVDLSCMFQEVLNDLEVAIAEKEAIIEIGAMGKIRGESLHLQQLFQNLISNSIKYSRPEATPRISITATQLSGSKTGFTLNEYELEKEYWQVRLQDNGQGFDTEQAQQIFKIFQRLPQHRMEYAGTGIGLAIVQRVVENHKGYIKAEGVPGEGATFTILLPVNA